MNVDFRDLAPAIAARVETLSQVPFIRYVNETVWIFAIVETAHLLFLAILGGAVLALNLRVLDVVLRDTPVQDVERATRPWLRAGIAGTVVTGVAMSITTLATLLPSAAFFLKMVALVAAILFSTAIARAVRRGPEAQAFGSVRIVAGAALLLWAASLVLFATTRGLGSGAALVALIGFVLFAAFAGRFRRIYLAGLGLLLGGGYLAVEIVTQDGAEGPAWLSLAPIAAALVFAIGVVARAQGDAARLRQPEKLAAFASILAWVTVAAAGRWIGFS